MCGGDKDLSGKQAARQERLHIAPAIYDEVNQHLAVQNPVNHAVGLEARLPVLFDPQGQQLFGITASLWEVRQICNNTAQAVQHRIGVGEAIKLSDVVVQGL